MRRLALLFTLVLTSLAVAAPAAAADKSAHAAPAKGKAAPRTAVHKPAASAKKAAPAKGHAPTAQPAKWKHAPPPKTNGKHRA